MWAVGFVIWLDWVLSASDTAPQIPACKHSASASREVLTQTRVPLPFLPASGPVPMEFHLPSRLQGVGFGVGVGAFVQKEARRCF